MKAKAHWNGIAKPLHGLGLLEANNNTDSRELELVDGTHRQKGRYCNVCRQRNS